MPSSSNPPRVESLPAGDYYILDIHELVDTYKAAPAPVRAVGTADLNMTDDELIDVSLSAIIPCLDDRDNADKELTKHGEEMLEQFAEEHAISMGKCAAAEQRIIPNTHEQLEYVKMVVDMGYRLKQSLEENGFYNENGSLKVEHCIVREDDSALILRSSN